VALTTCPVSRRNKTTSKTYRRQLATHNFGGKEFFFGEKNRLKEGAAADVATHIVKKLLKT